MLETATLARTAPVAPGNALLSVRNLQAWYGESHILHGMDFVVNRGEVVITDTPRNILSRGRTLIRHVQSGRPLEKTISSDPSALAQELHQHGLDKNISSIDLYPDTIEDIMLRIVDDAKSTE